MSTKACPRPLCIERGISLPFQFFSVKLQFNSEDHWTKALRYMLTNLKWGLAFVSTKYMKQELSEQQPSSSSPSSSS